MNITQLRYLSVVGKKKSITMAASELYISQQALSYSLSSLEKELGVELVVRTKDGISLTSCGRKVMSIADSLIEKYDTYTNMILAAVENERSVLTIAYENMVLMQATPYDLQSKIGDIRIKAILRNSARNCIEAVSDGKADIAFVFKPDDTNGLEYISIRDVTPVVILGKNHMYANREKLSISDLNYEQHYWLSDSVSFLDNYLKACMDEGFYPRIMGEYISVDMISAAVRGGAGIMLGGNILDFEREDQLVRIPLEHPTLRYQIGLLVRPEYIKKKEIQSYISSLKAVF